MCPNICHCKISTLQSHQAQKNTTLEKLGRRNSATVSWHHSIPHNGLWDGMYNGIWIKRVPEFFLPCSILRFLFHLFHLQLFYTVIASCEDWQWLSLKSTWMTGHYLISCTYVMSGWLWDSLMLIPAFTLNYTQYLWLLTTQDAGHWRPLVSWNCSCFPVSSSMQSCSLEVPVLHHKSSVAISSACVEPSSLAVPLISRYAPILKSLPIWWDSDFPTHSQLHLTYPLFPSCKHPSVSSVLPPVSIQSPQHRPLHSCRGYSALHCSYRGYCGCEGKTAAIWYWWHHHDQLRGTSLEFIMMFHCGDHTLSIAIVNFNG